MPKKKLFNGSNYVGFAADDKTYHALWQNAVYRNVSIADIIRAVMGAWAKSKHAEIPKDKQFTIDMEVAKKMRKG